ncbi:MAG: hypothetical protein BroJett040_10390 [Oligoflexia bacterium]|nr:MAG: hypothetical protein BroJett040_10390 [Oligoflexia bacterium]
MKKMVFSVLLLVGALAQAINLPSSSYDDYDRERYEEILRRTDDEMARAGNELRQSEENLRQAADRENRLRYEYDRTARDLQDSRQREVEIIEAQRQNAQRIQEIAKRIEEDNRRITELEKQVQDEKTSVDRLKSIADGLKGPMDAAQAEVVAQQQKVQKLQQDLAAAQPPQKPAIQEELNRANAELATLTQRRDQAKQRFDGAVQEQKRAEDRLRTAQQNLAAQKTELEKRRQSLAQAQQRERELAQNLQNNRQRMNDLNNLLGRLDRDLRYAISETRQRTYERDQSLSYFERRRADRDQAKNRLDQVDYNIDLARRELEAMATANASSDGDREGREIGRERGLRDGQRNGQTDGNAAGTNAGKDRDYDRGMMKGLSDAQAEAANPKFFDVPAEGRAYDRGAKDGFAFGYQTGTNKAKYQEGRKEGEANGLAQARQDALPQDGLGYQNRENFYLNQPLKQVSLGEAQPLAKGFNGVQGKNSTSGDDRYYNPRPGSLPHPRLTAFYNQKYDSVYRDQLEAIYKTTYDIVYKETYAANYKSAYDQAYAQNYQQSYDLGYKKAYRGFTDGNAAGSRKKGYDEGFKFAYDTNIENEKKLAYQRGVSRADELYTKNAVIKVVGMDIREMNRDGIYRPGETVQVVYLIKNFGLVGKSDLTSVVSSVNNTGTVVEARAQVPALPPQSEATITGRQQVQIIGAAEEGDTLQVQFKLEDSKQLVAQKGFEKTVQMPTVIQLVDFDGVVIPQEKTIVKVKATNRSQSVQNLTVDMIVDPTKISLPATRQQVVALNAGESRTLSFEMSGQAEARFQESEISVRADQGADQYGKLKQKVTIISRHKPTPDGRGLILSANLARGGGKSLYAFGKFDTWDLRVDGVISAEKLNVYKGKIVHVMADASAAIDAASAQSLSAFVQSGGQVIIWGSELQDSSLFASLQSMSQVKAQRSGNVNTDLNGQLQLAGLKISVKTAATLELLGRKSKAVLTSQFGTTGASSYMSGLADRVGRVYTVAANTSDLTMQSLQQLETLVNDMGRSYDEKLEMAKSDTKYLKLVMMEMQEEILTAELESSNHYDNNRKSNKITKAVLKFIKDAGRKSEIAKQFAKTYPGMMDYIESMKKVWSSATRASDYTSGFMPSWKNMFCEQESFHQRCQNMGG